MCLLKLNKFFLVFTCFAVFLNVSNGFDIVEAEGEDSVQFESPYTKRLRVLDTYRVHKGREPDVSGVYLTPNLKPAEARELWENIAKGKSDVVYPEVLTPRTPLSSQFKEKLEGGVKLTTTSTMRTEMKTLKPVRTTTEEYGNVTLDEEFDSVVSPVTSTSTSVVCNSRPETDQFSDMSDLNLSGQDDLRKDLNDESVSESDLSDRGENHLSVDLKESQKDEGAADVSWNYSWNYSYPLVPYDMESLALWVDSEIARLTALKEYTSKNMLEVLEIMWAENVDGEFHRDPAEHITQFIDDSISLAKEFKSSCKSELTSIKEARGAAYGIAERVDIAVEIATLYASKISEREAENVRKFSRDYMKEPIVFYEGVFSIGFGTPNEETNMVLESAKLVIRDPNASHEDIQSAIDALRVREMLLESMTNRRVLISKFAASQVTSMVNADDSVIKGIIQTNHKHGKRLGCEKRKCRDPKKSKLRRSECKNGECVKTEWDPDCHRLTYTNKSYACVRHEASCKDPECIGTHCVRGKCVKGSFRKGHCVKGECEKGECEKGKCKGTKYEKGDFVEENCQLPRRKGFKCKPAHVEDNKCQVAHREGDHCTPAHVKGSECKEVRYCENPRCVKGECERGECVSGKCKTGKWESGHCKPGKCVEGECKKPTCVKGEFNCPRREGGYCKHTECENGTCQGTSCKASKCVDGKCQAPRCEGGKCKPRHCEGGECRRGRCEGAECKPAHCEGGNCSASHVDWDNKKSCKSGDCSCKRKLSKPKEDVKLSPFVNPMLNSYLAEGSPHSD